MTPNLLKIKLKKYSFLFFIFILLVLNLLPANAQATELRNKKIVLIVVNYVYLDDFSSQDTPFIFNLIKNHSSGLMNALNAGPSYPGNGYLTIGCGVRSNATVGGGSAYQIDEKIPLRQMNSPFGEDIKLYDEPLNIYQQRTGISTFSLSSKSIININISEIKRANKEYYADIIPGLLGSSLEEKGLKTAVIGNADTPREVHREISLIAMNKEGIVPLGRVDASLLIEDKSRLSGHRTNYPFLLELFSQFIQEADLIAIETGDTSRIYYESPYAHEEVVKTQRKKALAEIDNFVAEVIKRMNFKKELLIIVSPNFREIREKKENVLTSIIIQSPNLSQGRLSSMTTRIDGIVTNEDIAPTIINFMGGEIPYQIAGEKISSLKGENSFLILKDMSRRFVFSHWFRYYFILFYLIISFIYFLVCFSIIALRKKLSQRAKNTFLFTILALLSVPFISLFLSFFNYDSTTLPLLFIIISSTILSLFSLLFKKRLLLPFIIIFLATSFLLFLGGLRIIPLLSPTIFGSDPIVGGRFYGLNNDQMGFLIGSLIVGLFFLFDTTNMPKIKRFLLGIPLFIIASLVIGLPYFGANAGGLIAASTATFIGLILFMGRKVKIRHLLAGIIIGFIFLFAILLINYFLPSPTHLGQSFILLQKGGLIEWINITIRKILANLGGATKEIWGFFIIGAIVLYILFYFAIKNNLNIFQKKFPSSYQGFIAVSLGSIAGFLFNDTGLAVAGAMMLYVLLPLLYFLAIEFNEGNFGVRFEN